MAKKKASKKASKKVKSKAKLEKQSKSGKKKAGRRWFLLASNLVAQKGSVLEKVLRIFMEADEHCVGENDLLAALQKAGVKDIGKKTVKKQMKGCLRNMSRAGVIAKERDVKKLDKGESDLVWVLKLDGGDDSDDAEDDDEEEDEDSEDDDEDADDESESEDDDAEEDDEEEKPKKKKKVVKRKK